MDITPDIRRNGYSKNRLICDCAGDPTHAITTLLSYSLLLETEYTMDRWQMNETD